MTDPIILAVQFEDGALVISYMHVPDDVRVDGAVAIQKTARLGMQHPDYEEDATRLHDRVVRVLKNALEDFEASAPYIHEEPDEDDERGMGE